VSPLALYLLGPPRIERDGVPLKLDRRKAMALVAYLAVTGQSHRRDSLVDLLWPDSDASSGRAALRRTLFALSAAIGADWLDADREEIGLKPGTEVWVDLIQFRRHLAACQTHGHSPSEVCPACVEPLTEAVALARGEFLSGFSLKDSFTFDDWQLFQAELVHRELAEALDKLARWHSAQRAFEPALGYARRRLALDPLDEDAHCQLMRLHAWSGRRSAALRQYQDCVAILEDQLGVSPQEETANLYNDIQQGRAPPLPDRAQEQQPGAAPERPPEPPSFLRAAREAERPVFVARERELAQLGSYLEAALDGHGQVAFVTGEAGSGKSALIQEFAWRAQAAHPDLVVAGGHGNAHTGAGDPYLPFRAILGLLAGDVEAQWAAGAMTQEQAGRLWRLLPLTVQALLRSGPDLIGLFVPGQALLERARMVRPWPVDPPLCRLEELATREPDPAHALHLQQTALFEQYTQVLRALAACHPLLLMLDDLQWADSGSLRLLFHLGRQLAGNRILLLGAYRPAEVGLGRPASLVTAAPPGAESDEASERHPLEPVVNELKRTFGPIEVDLEQVEGRTFVEALLDSEPNCLGGGFREALHQRTQGHPLFTVELLRGMQERGDLIQDSERRWVEGQPLDWETLPARVEAVIAERLGRLPHRLRGLLSVASVEGETFTAEVLAQVQAAGEQEMIRSLSETLDRRHRLVTARGMVRAGSRRLSQYRFRHILYQRYLYGTLDAVERAHLHEQVGTALEGLYGPQEAGAAAVQLARHFEEAGIPEKAIGYLYQASQRALQLSAYHEALDPLRRALALLMTLPHSPERDRQELTLQLALGVALQGVMGTQSLETRDAYTRARELCRQTGETSQLCRVLGELALHHYTRAEHCRAREHAELALAQAQLFEDPLLEGTSRWTLGLVLFCLGEHTTARAHLQRVIDFYVPQEHHRTFVLLRGSDAGVSAMGYQACNLWCLGYPDQALQWSRQALSLARALGHPFSLADVLAYGGCLFDFFRRDAQALMQNAEALIRLATEKVPVWLTTAQCYRGGALALVGRAQEALVQLRQGMAVSHSKGVGIDLSMALAFTSMARAGQGRLEEALTALAEALALVERTDERHSEAELHRVRSELLLIQGDEAEAEASLHRAVEIARRQSARSWELRATTTLARLWQMQGRTAEARQALAEIYGWFTEGFDTPDLQEAKALLDELAQALYTDSHTQIDLSHAQGWADKPV